MILILHSHVHVGLHIHRFGAFWSCGFKAVTVALFAAIPFEKYRPRISKDLFFINISVL